MDIVLDLLVLITTMTVFLMNMDFRTQLKKVILLFVLFGIISFSIYIMLIQMGFNKEIISLLCFSIPSLILCFWVSKYRDARFIFTFAVVDLIGVFAVILGRCISIPFDFNQNLIFVFTAIMLVLYIIGAFKFRKNYLEILNSVSNGWNSMALASIMIYVFTFMLIAYPEPIISRREYLPTVILYLVLVIIIFKVIYDSAKNNIKIYVERLEKENLSMKLELNQVYYDMAYKDNLSGLKNRNAYEEYLNKIESESNNNLLCISFDIDNLKDVNDRIGHHAGDEIIKSAGKILKETFRMTDNIFRIGGDEFIVIIEDKSEQWADEMFSLMDEKAKVVRNDYVIPFEYSKGKCFGKNSDIRMLIKMADKEMYEEKRRHKEYLI